MVRGATPLKPDLLNKKPIEVAMGTGQPHSWGYGSFAAYTLSLDNGGYSGAG